MTLDKYNSKCAELAVHDWINLKFVQQLFHFEAKKNEIIAENEKLPPHMDNGGPLLYATINTP